jgi:hypothetical protein
MKINIKIDEQQTVVLNLEESPLKENSEISLTQLENFVSWLHSKIIILNKLSDDSFTKTPKFSKTQHIRYIRYNFSEQQLKELISNYKNAKNHSERSELAKKYGFRDSKVYSQFVYITLKNKKVKQDKQDKQDNNIPKSRKIENPSGTYSGKKLTQKEELEFLKEYDKAKTKEQKQSLVKKYSILNMYCLNQKRYRIRKSRGLI